MEGYCGIIRCRATRLFTMRTILSSRKKKDQKLLYIADTWTNRKNKFTFGGPCLQTSKPSTATPFKTTNQSAWKGYLERLSQGFDSHLNSIFHPTLILINMGLLWEIPNSVVLLRESTWPVILCCSHILGCFNCICIVTLEFIQHLNPIQQALHKEKSAGWESKLSIV